MASREPLPLLERVSRVTHKRDLDCEVSACRLLHSYRVPAAVLTARWRRDDPAVLILPPQLVTYCLRLSGGYEGTGHEPVNHLAFGFLGRRRPELEAGKRRVMLLE